MSVTQKTLAGTLDAEQRLLQSIGVPLTSGDIKIDDVNIHYVTVGSGPPLLLLHGANIGWGQWYQNIGEYAKHFRVYAIDLPGSGKSTSIDFRNIDLVKSFVGVTENFIKVKKLEPINIIGHSIGGWIALKLVLRKKVKINKIVLANSLGFSHFVPWQHRLLGFYPYAKIISKTAMKPNRKNMEKFLTSVLYQPSPPDKRFIDYFLENIRRTNTSHPFIFINGMLQNFKMRDELLLQDDLSKIDRPTLIIAGNNDPLIPLNKISPYFKLIPQVKTHILAKTGHVSPTERPDDFDALTIKYLTT